MKQITAVKTGSMLEEIKRGLSLMTSKEQRIAAILMALSLVDGLLQTVAIVAIVPLVQLMIDPSSAPLGWILDWLRSILNISDQKVLLVAIASGVIVLVLTRALFGWVHVGKMAKFSAGCEMRLSSLLMNRILKAPYAWMVRQDSVRLRQLLFGYVSAWSRDFVRILMKLVNDFSFVVFIVSAMIIAQPLAGIVALGVSMILGVVIFGLVRPRLRFFAQEKRRGILGANKMSTEAVMGFKEVKMAGAEDRFVQLFDEQVNIYAGVDSKAQQWVQLPRFLLESIAYITLISLSIILVIFDVRGQETSGIVLLFGFAAIRLLPLFSTVISGFATLLSAFPLIAELDNLIRVTEAPEGSDNIQLIPKKWKKFLLEDVSFKYEKNRTILDGVSLSIEPGRSYGVVGPSGAGKSTLIDLIAGLLEPSSGRVMLDGITLSPSKKMQWRGRFGYVGQRPFLLDASLSDNIIFNTNSEFDEDRVKKVIRLCRLEQVLARMPGGLQGELGEGGTFLSGGEAQRVAIARALYRGADLLILDEATNSLDTIVEQEILESIKTLRGEVTTIIVAHKMELICNCDEIWLFDNAKLVAKGTHQQLLATSDLYGRLTSPEQEG